MRGIKFEKKKPAWFITASPVKPLKKISYDKNLIKTDLKANNNDDWRCRYESFCNTDDIYELQLYSNNRYLTYKSTYFPQARGQGTAMYAICATVKGYGFTSSLLWDRVYKSESLSLKSGIISRTLMNCLKILV